MNIVSAPMSHDEARACVNQIAAHIQNARALILDLYERRGWEALGYESWRECVVSEFQASQSYMYRQLAAAMTEREISPIGEIGVLPEAQTRELSGLAPDEQRAVWAEAVATAPGGKVTAAHVRAVARISEARISEALSAAPEPVREVVERFGVADADTISELTRLHKQKADTFAEVAASGWIQPGDEESAVRIDSGALAVREALREKAQTHRLLAADERRESTRCPNCGFSF